jgi:hypothetical protein
MPTRPSSVFRLLARRIARFGVACMLLVAACVSHAPLRLSTPPNDRIVWRAELGKLGEQLFVGMRNGRLEGALARLPELEPLLTPEGQQIIERERQDHDASFVRARVGPSWTRAAYAGFCAQGVHAEPAKSHYGLRDHAWTFERMLVVARKGRGRSAAWVDGRFVYTSRGWLAFSVTGIETPRAHHTDLELAPCDVQEGIR